MANAIPAGLLFGQNVAEGAEKKVVVSAMKVMRELVQVAGS